MKTEHKITKFDAEILNRMRRNTIAGNWKMNTDLFEGRKLGSEIINMISSEIIDDTDIIHIPPFTLCYELRKMAEGNLNIHVGAQNCHFEKSGAFTGEISCEMLKSLGLSHVVIGHSERREIFNENDEMIGKKVLAALKNGLIPIFCCGEPLDIRQSSQQNDYVFVQIKNSLFNLNKNEFEKVIIAYEPIWAIGTGLTASPEQAQEMHAAIREMIRAQFGTETADFITILYGGSVKADNAAELFSCKDVDGGLVGGASLNSRSFVDIAKSF